MKKLDVDLVAPRLSVAGIQPPPALMGGPPLALKSLGYDILVLCAQENQSVEADILSIRLPLLDTEAPGQQIVSGRDIIATVRLLAEERSRGKHVLTACYAGANRSALIAALVLVQSGWTAEGAIEAIQQRRRSRTFDVETLSNRRFVSAIKDFAKRRA